jgi:beta-lactamase class A
MGTPPAHRTRRPARATIAGLAVVALMMAGAVVWAGGGTLVPGVTPAPAEAASPADPSNLVVVAGAALAEAVPVATALPPLDAVALRAQLERRLSAAIGDSEELSVSITVIDVDRHVTISIGGDIPRVAASTTKLPVALTLAVEAQRGTISLDQTVDDEVLAEEDAWYYQGTPLGEIEDDALIHSDNDAHAVMIATLGEAAIQALMKRAGGLSVPWARGENLTTTDDLALYMRALLRRSRNGGAAARFLSDLEHSDFDEWVPLGLPDGVRSAHKVGSFEDATGDVGVFWVGDRPVIVSILASGFWDEGSLPLVTGLVWDTYLAELAADPAAPRPALLEPRALAEGLIDTLSA